MNIKQYCILLSFFLASSLYGLSVTIVNNTSHDFNYTITLNPYQAVCTTKTDIINAGQSKNLNIGSCCVQNFIIKSTSVNAQGQFIEKSIPSSMAQFGVCWKDLTFTINETDGAITVIESQMELKKGVK
ncbi:MAG TPA: hypothetical protein VGW78_03720 [Candidatus Babeliales bacterium]|jgi:hypothetical protein|nr:hypothetical protein [Candidatus Babeliales bacterium]